MAKNCLLVSAGWLLTAKEDRACYEDWAFLIEDGIVSDMGPRKDLSAKYSTTDKLALNEHIVCPGLINCHNHAAMKLMRGLGQGLNLDDWLHQAIWPFEKEHLDAPTVGLGAELAMVEMLMSGITTFSDMYFFPETVASVAERLGLNIQLAVPIISLDTRWARGSEECIHQALALHDLYRDHQHVSVSFGPHSVEALDLETLEKIGMYADELDLGIQIHLQETSGELDRALKKHGHSFVVLLKKIGLMNERLQVVHAVHLTSEDKAILAETNANVIHCPSSNLLLGSGICPTKDLLELGVNVALGTDGSASNNGIDLLSEAALAESLIKGIAQDASVYRASNALGMTTINGARALGLERQIGSLEVGKDADFIAFDTRHPAIEPMIDPFRSIISNSGARCISYVYAKGKPLIENGICVNTDLADLRERAADWRASKVFREVGGRAYN